ncbi:MAG: hypothetical protein DME57_01010 [Verrucomicrobia bacterium]|nr:MAG: hypothetical protein DME57_01010 [Verrucomicrobiota bacterium]
MQPSEALSTSAQIAVTLAGFAGVVVAFRNRAVHEWSKIDRLRLRILLVNSGVPFLLSILGMVLSATTIEPTMVWRFCSLITFVIVVFIAQGYSRSRRDFSRAEFKASGARIWIFYTGSLLGTAAVLLQLYNVISLQTFWPFFAAIATLLVLAMAQFILLVLAVEENQS